MNLIAVHKVLHFLQKNSMISQDFYRNPMSVDYVCGIFPSVEVHGCIRHAKYVKSLWDLRDVNVYLLFSDLKNLEVKSLLCKSPSHKVFCNSAAGFKCLYEEEAEEA